MNDLFYMETHNPKVKETLNPIVLYIGDFTMDKSHTSEGWKNIENSINSRKNEIKGYVANCLYVKEYDLNSLKELISANDNNEDLIIPIAISDKGKPTDYNFRIFFNHILINFNIYAIISSQPSHNFIHLRNLTEYLTVPVLITLASNSDLLLANGKSNLEHMLRLVPSNEQQVGWLTSLVKLFSYTNDLSKAVEKTGFVFYPSSNNYVNDIRGICERQGIRGHIIQDVKKIRESHHYENLVFVGFPDGLAELHNHLGDKIPKNFILTDGCDDSETEEIIKKSYYFCSEKGIVLPEYNLIKYLQSPATFAEDAFVAIIKSYISSFQLATTPEEILSSREESIKKELEKNTNKGHYKFINNENTVEQFERYQYPRVLL